MKEVLTYMVNDWATALLNSDPDEATETLNNHRKYLAVLDVGNYIDMLATDHEARNGR